MGASAHGRTRPRSHQHRRRAHPRALERLPRRLARRGRPLGRRRRRRSSRACDGVRAMRAASGARARRCGTPATGTGAWSSRVDDAAECRRARAGVRGVPGRPAAARHQAVRARAPGGAAMALAIGIFVDRAGRDRQREGPPDQDRAGRRGRGRGHADDLPGAGDRGDRLQHARPARRDDADRPADRDDRRLHVPGDPRRPDRAGPAVLRRARAGRARRRC